MVSLATLRGKVVVLSFFDAACDDICPVLEAGAFAGRRRPRPLAGRVAVIAVNTDPLALSTASARPAEEAARAPSTPAWYFLTGALTRLDAVWSSYGIAIDVQRDSGLVSHNDFLYFIDPSGRLRSGPHRSQTRTPRASPACPWALRQPGRLASPPRPKPS